MHRRNGWLLLALTGLLLIPPSDALQHEEGLPDARAQDRQARSLHILQYHPYPDPAGDDWGIPGGTKDESSVGYMESAYDSFWYPTALLDGMRKVEGATTFLETYNAYEAHYLERVKDDAPLRVALNGFLGDGNARMQIDVRAKQALRTDAIELRAVLFEDEIPFEGKNGVKVHRFTVRNITLQTPLVLAENASRSLEAITPMAPAWNTDRLGFVVSVHNRDAESPDYEPGEVLQAATFRFNQDGPTIQFRRGVLLEVLTATWCAACVYGDAAVDELSNAYGIPSSKFLNQHWEYLRPLAAVPLGMAGFVGLVAGGAVWVRDRRGGPGP